MEISELIQRRHGDHGLFPGLRDAREDAVQRVVILRRDRVELVVVAARARDGQAEETFGHRVDAVVDHVVRVIEPLADRDEAERGEPRVVGFDVRQLVRRELLDDELVVRLVLVERLDHVVAIGPGVGKAVVHPPVVPRAADGVGVARGIEPVAAPALTVGRRGEQALDDFRKSLRRLIAQKTRHLLRRRRQAGEVVGRAAEQRFLARVGRGDHAFLLDLREDEAIHRRPAPHAVLDRRHRGLRHGLVGPVVAGLVGQAGEFGLRDFLARIGRAHFHPLGQRRDLVVLQLAALLARRHLQILVLVFDRLEQRTRLGIAGHDRWADLAAFEHAVARVERQPALGFAVFEAVALVAVVREDRADFALEKSGLFRRGLHRHGGESGGVQARKGKDEEADGPQRPRVQWQGKRVSFCVHECDASAAANGRRHRLKEEGQTTALEHFVHWN